MKKLLIVDDERAIRIMLQRILTKEGFEVREAATGEEALSMLEVLEIDGVLLDLGLPDMDGLDVLRSIRGTSNLTALPVFLVTAKNDEIDTILGLEMGADDYITKPFRKRELVARIKATYKRIERDQQNEGKFYQLGNLKIFQDTHKVYYGEEVIELSPKEFNMLMLFVKNPNRVFSRTELLDQIWDDAIAIEPRTVDVHIRRLRQKIDRQTSHTTWIETVRGMGYRLSK